MHKIIHVSGITEVQLTISTSSNQLELFVITQLKTMIIKGDHLNFLSDLTVLKTTEANVFFHL